MVLEIVKENLEELDIDISELDLDLNSRGKLTIEDCNIIHEAVIEAQRQKLKQKDGDDHVLHADDIEYYDVNSTLASGDTPSPEEISNAIDELEKSGLNADDMLLEPIVVERDSASSVYDEVSMELIRYASEEMSEKRFGKLNFALEVMENENLEMNEAIRWFEEKDDLELDQFTDSTNLNLGKHEKIYDQTIEHFWDDLKERDIDDRELVKRAMLLDITKTLEGLVLSKENPQEFSQQVQDYQDFLHKFRPEEYEERLHDSEYKLHELWSKHKISIISRELETCLTRYENDDANSFEDNVFREASKMYKDDPFTFVQAIGKDDKVEGYVRSFLMRDSNDDMFLGVDNIEARDVDGVEIKDIHEDIEEKEDIISAGVLGAIELGNDLGVDYVAGKDARIKFGPRPAYGNTSRDIVYEKIGDPVPYYSVVKNKTKGVSKRHPNKITSYTEQLSDVEQLDNDKWAYKFETSWPGFAVYHEPGKQEVRGFQTEEGWHETEAKILMEFPSK